MKAVLIIHNEAISSNVEELLNSVGIDSYTKFTRTLGKGKLSDPHLDTDIWPGTNIGTFVVTDPAKADDLMNGVRRLRQSLGTEGIKAFMWQIDDIT
jgi:hypothetical protein